MKSTILVVCGALLAALALAASPVAEPGASPSDISAAGTGGFVADPADLDPTCSFDICIVIDASGSIDASEWAQQANAVKEIAAAFTPTAQSQTRFAVAEAAHMDVNNLISGGTAFSGSASGVSTYAECCALPKADQKAGCRCSSLLTPLQAYTGTYDLPYTGSGTEFTDVSRAMKICQDHLKAEKRANVPQLMIVMTDGITNAWFENDDITTPGARHYCVTQTNSVCVADADANFLARSNSVKADGVELVYVGVGDPEATSLQQRRRDALLQTMGSDPADAHYFAVDNTAGLQALARQIATAKCQKKGCHAAFDVMLVMDKTGSIGQPCQGCPSLVPTVVKGLEIVVEKFDPKHEDGDQTVGSRIGFTRFDTSATCLKRLTWDQTDLRRAWTPYPTGASTCVGCGVVMGKTCSEGSPNNRKALGVPQVAIIMTDGNSNSGHGADSALSKAAIEYYDYSIIVALGNNVAMGPLETLKNHHNSHGGFSVVARATSAADTTNFAAVLADLIETICAEENQKIQNRLGGGGDNAQSDDGKVLGMEVWMLAAIGGGVCCVLLVCVGVVCACVAKSKKGRANRGGVVSRSHSRGGLSRSQSRARQLSRSGTHRRVNMSGPAERNPLTHKF